MRAAIAIALAATIALASCGGDDSSDPASAAPPKQEPKQETIAGLAELESCLGDLAYQVDRYDKDGIHVNGGDDARVADIDIHPTEKAAEKFYAQLVVEGAQGGRFTVTYNMGGSDETERAVIADCVQQAG